MTPDALQRYLHEHIPLAAAMGVGVLAAGEQGVVLEAPLGPNINHRETVFGGSASAVAILAAWSCLHWNLLRAGMAVRVVIQRNSMEYLQPIAGTFTVNAALPEDATWQRFLRTIRRRGRARVGVQAQLEYGGLVAGRFAGEFVAVASVASSRDR